MINFIMKLEDMLTFCDVPDWEIIYVPNMDGYILKLDGHEIYMTDISNTDRC